MSAKIVDGINVRFGLSEAQSTGNGRSEMAILGTGLVILGLVAMMVI